MCCIRYYFLISLIISIAWCNLECNYTVTWISYLVSMYETVSLTVIQLLTFCTARVLYYPVLLCDSEFENHNVNVCDVPQHYFTPVMKAMATNCTDYWDATAAWRVKYRDHPWEIDTAWPWSNRHRALWSKRREVRSNRKLTLKRREMWIA